MLDKAKSYVLVVDDNQDHIRIIKKSLSSGDLHIEAVHKVEDTFSHLSAFEYHLLLVDIMLPEINGLELLQKIRYRFPKIPIIVMSAFGSEDDAVIAMKEGATDYIPKSIGFEHRIADVVNNTLKQTHLEKKLNEAQLKYEQIFNAANDYIFSIDLNAHFMSYNKKFAELVQEHELDSLVGKSFFDVLPNETKGKVLESFQKVVYENAKPELYNLFIYDKSKEKRYLELNTSLLRENNRITGVLCVARDVSDVKRMQEEQSDLHYRLMEKHQLALIGRMVQGIAHNINTPLATILGHSELLQLRFPKEQEIDTIITQCENIRDIIRNMVHKVQNEQSSHAEFWDINHIIEEELSFFNANSEFKHHIIKHIELDPSIPRVRLIYQNFTQAFDAFIQNAIDAVANCKTKVLTVRTHQEKDTILLDIEDSACSLKEDDIEKLFRPFYTTKNELSHYSENLGLGLYNAYLLMQPYGIRFNVDLNEKRTQFRWTIPIEDNK